MHKQRIYIDTSVIGGCFDEMFAEWSNKLFAEFIKCKKIAVISDVTTSELYKAPDNVRNRIDDIPSENIIKIDIDDDIEELASKCIEFKAVSIKSQMMQLI